MNVKDPYAVECSVCGYTYTNHHISRLYLSAGNYCPLCGSQYSIEDQMTQKEYHKGIENDDR